MDELCRRYRRFLLGDLEFDFRVYLHECKDCGDRGTDSGDFTDSELIEKLKEFLDLEELQ